MKTLFKTIIAAALTMSLAASCDKLNNENSGNSEPCTLDVSLGGAFDSDIATRLSASDAGGDAVINSVQFFVFNTDNGKLDAASYESVGGEKDEWTATRQLNCTTGPRQVYALVNCPVDYVNGSEKIKNLTELNALTVKLSDNSARNLVMTGSEAPRTFVPGNNNSSVDVYRRCAVVVLKTVENEMYAPVYRDKLEITGAYLMTVPGENMLFNTKSAHDVAAEKWYAKNKKELSSDVAALLGETFGSPVSLSYDTPRDFGNVFYSMPNDISSDSASTWDRSGTYLIVEAKVAGEACVYPIKLGELKSNFRYDVSLVIHRVGGNPNRPFEEVEFSDITAVVNVAPWTGGNEIDQVI